MKALSLVAHCDDESLFMGGTLLKLADAGWSLVVAVATAPGDCNRIPHAEQQKARMEARLEAFRRSLADLGAEGLCLNLPNRQPIQPDWIAELIESIAPDLILSHGDDSGHPQHLHLTQAMLDATSVWLSLDRTVWLTARDGNSAHGLRLPIDVARKRQLLEHYRVGGTRTPEWNPWENPDYEPWCGEYERFTSVVRGRDEVESRLTNDCGLDRTEAAA